MRMVDPRQNETLIMVEKELTLEMLGWNRFFEDAFQPWREQGCEPARVAVEDKHFFTVLTAAGACTAQVTGKVLHQARSTSDLPKVGDWVALSVMETEEKGIIQEVLPRRTKLSRKSAGREIEEQVLVTNIDVAFIIQALDATFNPRLMERHLLMVRESGARPALVLNKADLGEDLERRRQALSIAGDAPVFVVSARTGHEMEGIAQSIRPGETVVFMGPSGVGKSTLINQLYGEEIQATADVREADGKGRHTTTWREMILLPQGGLVIDTPGMREFHLWMAHEGMLEAFTDIEALALGCHFRGCTHSSEKRCAVQEAVASGGIARERYDSYLKLKSELHFLDQSHYRHGYASKRRRERENLRFSRKKRR
jgi:ribosome biogenesis GTPase / thiamine phosphate phosphatase